MEMCSLYNYSENFNKCLLEIISITQQKMSDIQDIILKLDQRTTISNISTEISDTLIEILLNSQMSTFIEKKFEIERQMLTFLPSFQNMDYLSRLNLRLLIGLPASFKEDSQAIKTLDGAISEVTNEKMDVTEKIRRIRDNE